MAGRPKPARPELKHLASRVLSLREARGLSRKEVADRGGLSQAQVEKIERAEDEPMYLTLVALARGMGVDPALVVSDKYPPDVPLVQRQPPTAWKTLGDAAGFLQALAAEMATYEAARNAPPPAADDEASRPKKRRGPRRR